MYVEPAIYQHVEVILGLARRRPREGVAAADLAADLALPTTTVANLLRNLSAAGLLWARPGDGGPCFGLARMPQAITLAEVTAVAEPIATGGRRAPEHDGGDGAQAGVAALSASIDACAQRLMHGLTVADLLGDGDAAAVAGEPASGRTPGDAGAQGAVAPSTLWRWAEMGQPHAVVDVRADPAVGAPAPPWAHWMPLERLPRLQQQLPREHPIVTVCASGARSEMAAQYLRSIGFGQARALAGGLAAWQRARPGE